MEINFAGTYANYPTTGKPKSTGNGQIGQTDFLRLLTSELAHQDPFDPMSNQDILSQIMMIQDMQTSAELNNTIKSLLHESRMSSAASLLGCTVRGANSTSGEVSGIVTGIAVTGNTIELVLNGNGANRLPLQDVTDVKITLPEGPV